MTATDTSVTAVTTLHQSEKRSNYLPQAIGLTILCCMPIGVVAIVKAAQVNSKLAVGDWQGAMNASASARTWCWVAFACGLVANIIIGGLMLAAS